MFAYPSREVIQETILFTRGLWQAFLIIGIGPGLVGAFILFKRNRCMGVALVLMFIFHAIVFINYRVVDKELMFFPCYLIWALWLGMGYQWLEEIIQKIEIHSIHKPKYSISFIALWAMRGLISIVVVFSFAWKYKLVDQSDDWSTRQLGEQILEQVEPNALIFGYWDVVPVIEYLTLVEGHRPDVQPVNRFLVTQDDLKQWIVREISHRTIYIDHPILDLKKNIRIVEQGELYHLIQIKPN